MTEPRTGRWPEFARPYGAGESPTASYGERTRETARDSDGTPWFSSRESPGGKATLGACRALGKPFLIVSQNLTRPSDVAGNRESKSPGIGGRVAAFLVRVFTRLGHPPAPPDGP